MHKYFIEIIFQDDGREVIISFNELKIAEEYAGKISLKNPKNTYGI